MSLSTSDKLVVEIRGNVALLTIDTPAANTWDVDSLPALKEVVKKLNDDKDIYALVITGEGKKFFSAGADLKLFADGDPQTAADMARFFGEGFEALADFRGVSIAAINGFAMGGGLEVALACDIRIAETQAKMALPEAKVGLLPCAGGTQRLSWLVGEGWAKRIILCGERLDATTAEKIGLVEEVVGQGKSLERALVLAEQVGFDSVWRGEHHFCDYILSAPPVVLAAIAAWFVYKSKPDLHPRAGPALTTKPLVADTLDTPLKPIEAAW